MIHMLGKLTKFASIPKPESKRTIMVEVAKQLFKMPKRAYKK